MENTEQEIILTLQNAISNAYITGRIDAFKNLISFIEEIKSTKQKEINQTGTVPVIPVLELLKFLEQIIAEEEQDLKATPGINFTVE